MKNESVSKYILSFLSKYIQNSLCYVKKKSQILLKSFYWNDKDQSCSYFFSLIKGYLRLYNIKSTTN